MALVTSSDEVIAYNEDIMLKFRKFTLPHNKSKQDCLVVYLQYKINFCNHGKKFRKGAVGEGLVMKLNET